MQAYYEIETQIPDNHLLKLSLPDTIPSGYAKIAVIYEIPEIKPALTGQKQNTPQHSIKQLKGIAPKPQRVISLEEMNNAIQMEGAKL